VEDDVGNIRQRSAHHVSASERVPGRAGLSTICWPVLACPARFDDPVSGTTSSR
jgi:hypothetical protein